MARAVSLYRELPYMVNKASLIEKIAELVKDKKVDGITDLSDESSREGMRIVIELRKDVQCQCYSEPVIQAYTASGYVRCYYAGTGRQ